MKTVKYFILTIIFISFVNCDVTSPNLNIQNDLKITFLSNKDSSSEIHIELGSLRNIYEMNTDGNNLTKITNTSGYYGKPQYSHDGSKILLSISKDWLDSGIYLMNSNGENLVSLSEGKSAIFSPNGTKVAYSAGGLIAIMDINGQNKKMLTQWEGEYYTTIGQDQPFAFSPDGNKIYYSKRTSYLNIYSMNIDGTEVKNLSFNVNKNYYASLSKDGEKIIYNSGANDFLQIFIMNSNGSDQKQLTNDEGKSFNPKISEDGLNIVYSNYMDNKSALFIIDIDGNSKTKLTPHLAGNYDNYFISEDNKIYYTYSENQKSILYVMDIDGNNRKRISNFEGSISGVSYNKMY